MMFDQFGESLKEPCDKHYEDSDIERVTLPVYIIGRRCYS